MGEQLPVPMEQVMEEREEPLLGGVSQSDTIIGAHDVCTAVRPFLEAFLELSYESFEAMEVRQQVVAGTMWFIRVQADGDILDLKVWQLLPHYGAGYSIVGLVVHEGADPRELEPLSANFPNNLVEPIQCAEEAPIEVVEAGVVEAVELEVVMEEEAVPSPEELVAQWQEQIKEIERMQASLESDKAALQAQIDETLGSVQQPEEASNTVQIHVRMSQTRCYDLEVQPDITINQIRSLIIDAISAQMRKKGAADTKKPFDERQIDIFHPATSKVLFSTKKLSEIQPETRNLIFNVRQWTGGH